MYEATSTWLVVENLHPYYQYLISVSAVTVGEGPSTFTIGFFTNEDGKQTWKETLHSNLGANVVLQNDSITLCILGVKWAVCSSDLLF